MFPKLPNFDQGPEWALLELIALGLGSEERDSFFKTTVRRPDLDAQELMRQARRHKLVALLACCLEEQSQELADGEVMAELRRRLALNRRRMVRFRDEAIRLTRRFEALDIRCVCTKGITFESTLYHASGGRQMHDIDLMIHPSSRQSALAALADLGYRAGNYDEETGTIVELDRREQLVYKLSPDHLPHLQRLTGEPDQPFMDIDIANSLTWTRSEWQVPVEAALAEREWQPVPGREGEKIPCFASPFQLIFTTLHLFREAWFERNFDGINDVTLAKFGDVARLWAAHREAWETLGLPRLLEELQVAEPVLWVLEHLDRTFGTDTVRSLEMAGRAGESWLSSGMKAGDQLLQWRGTMRQRLHSSDRQSLFKAPVPA